MRLSKSYKRIVFGGKDVAAIGIDQGKGPLYRGDAVKFCLNLLWDNALQTRDGLTNISTYKDSIVLAKNESNSNMVAEGTNIWGEAK